MPSSQLHFQNVEPDEALSALSRADSGFKAEPASFASAKRHSGLDLAFTIGGLVLSAGQLAVAIWQLKRAQPQTVVIEIETSSGRRPIDTSSEEAVRASIEAALEP